MTTVTTVAAAWTTVTAAYATWTAAWDAPTTNPADAADAAWDAYVAILAKTGVQNAENAPA